MLCTAFYSFLFFGLDQRVGCWFLFRWENMVAYLKRIELGREN